MLKNIKVLKTQQNSHRPSHSKRFYPWFSGVCPSVPPCQCNQRSCTWRNKSGGSRASFADLLQKRPGWLLDEGKDEPGSTGLKTGPITYPCWPICVFLDEPTLETVCKENCCKLNQPACSPPCKSSRSVSNRESSISGSTVFSAVKSFHSEYALLHIQSMSWKDEIMGRATSAAVSLQNSAQAARIKDRGHSRGMFHRIMLQMVISAARSSARPTRLATASTWTGWHAKSKLAKDDSETDRPKDLNRKTESPLFSAWRATFTWCILVLTALNSVPLVCIICQRKVNVVRGR